VRFKGEKSLDLYQHAHSLLSGGGYRTKGVEKCSREGLTELLRKVTPLDGGHGHGVCRGEGSREGRPKTSADRGKKSESVKKIWSERLEPAQPNRRSLGGGGRDV